MKKYTYSTLTINYNNLFTAPKPVVDLEVIFREGVNF